MLILNIFWLVFQYNVTLNQIRALWRFYKLYYSYTSSILELYFSYTWAMLEELIEKLRFNCGLIEGCEGNGE